MDDRFFQTGHILIIHRVAQQIIELCGIGAAHFFGFCVGFCPGGDADLTLAGLAVDGGGGVCVFQQMPHAVFQIALAAQHPQGDRVQGAVLAGHQQRADALLPHGLHFVGHAGHQHGTVAVLLEPCAGGGAVVVDDLVAVHRNHGLLAVVGRGLAVGAGEESDDLLPLHGVEFQRVAVAGSHRLLGQVIRRGAKAAGEH